MKVIPPITLDHTNITSTALDTTDPAEWDTSASYAIGDRVKVTVSNINKIYECIIATTAADLSPEVDILKITPKWVEIGSINKYAMFDTLRSTKTTASKYMSIVLSPGQLVDSIAILGMSGINTVNISAKVDGGADTIVYEVSIDLNRRATNSWYTYFFGRYITKAGFARFDLPTNLGNLVITITFMGAEDIGVGAVVLGNALDIGSLQRGAKVDVLNFSSIQRDLYGTATLIPRRNVPKTRQELYIPKNRLNTVLQYKDELDSVSAVWSGLDDDINHPYYDAVLILGFYREFSFDINNSIGVYINLELEEI
jgi:hypothetical protein